MARMEHRWGTRSGHAGEIVEKVVQDVIKDVIQDVVQNVVQNTVQGITQYLKEHPANYQGQVDTLLELLYQAFTEYNSVETPEFKEQTDPLKEKLRALVETDEEADEYMDIVFSLCAAYERQGYIEGIKVGARLMLELVEPMGPIELVEPTKPMED